MFDKNEPLLFMVRMTYKEMKRFNKTHPTCKIYFINPKEDPECTNDEFYDFQHVSFCKKCGEISGSVQDGGHIKL
jgi:hypothetical protein